MAKILIGIDESGTGAIAGVATTCAYAILAEHEDWLRKTGAVDSKELNDRARRRILEELAEVALLAKVEYLTAEALSNNHKQAWREGIAAAATYILTEYLPGNSVAIIIDGNSDSTVLGYFERVWGLVPKFLPQADALFPVVSAASILAKTARNDAMLELAAVYPEWGFEKHYGYQTPLHMERIAAHGICPAHRRVRSLSTYFEGKP